MGFNTKLKLDNQNFKQEVEDVLNFNGTTILSTGNLETINIILNSGFNGIVNDIKKQSDGKLVVVGQFTTYSGVSANYIIRLNADFSIDESFITGSGFDSEAIKCAIQPDGKIVVVGGFSSYTGSTTNYLIRLNSDGTVDTDFRTNLGSGFDSYVFDVRILDDGKILVGGYFTSYNGDGSVTGVARLMPDGTLDTTFSTSGINVNSMAVPAPNGKVYFNNFGASVERLNSDGSYDGTFSAYFIKNNTVAVQDDGKILVSGFRLNDDGTLDTTFNNGGSGFDGTVYDIHILPDGKTMYSGDFTTFNGANTIYTTFVSRLNVDGSIDDTFDNTYANSYASLIRTIEPNNNGYFILGGYVSNPTNNIFVYDDSGNAVTEYVNGETSSLSFSGGTITARGVIGYDRNYSSSFNERSFVDRGYVLSVVNNGGSTSGLTASNGLTKVGNDIRLGGVLTGETTSLKSVINIGDISNTFVMGSGFNGPLRDITTSPYYNSMYVGGIFSNYNGFAASCYIKINSDGTVDESFDTGSGFNDHVRATAIQYYTDDKVVVGGNFSTYKGSSYNRIIRLNTDGSIDGSFIVGSGFDDVVNVVVIQPSDYKILVGGQFTSYSGVTANRLIRLNVDGSIDDTFLQGSGINGSTVDSIAIQSDSKILIGGNFYEYSGVSTYHIVRLNPDGSIDDTFSIGGYFDSSIRKIVYDQFSDKIYVGGFFTNYSGVTSNYFVRLNPDGSKDETFIMGTGFNNFVDDFVIQSSGQILLVGGFNSYNDESCNYIVRLNSDGTKDNTFVQGTGFNDVPLTIAIDSSERIMVGGDFSSYNGNSVNYIVQINNDHTEPVIVDINKNGFYYGDDFSATYNDRSLVDKGYVDNRIDSLSAVNGLTRDEDEFSLGGRINGETTFDILLPPGSLDKTFTGGMGSGFNNAVRTIYYQSFDAKLLVGGYFSTYKGNTANKLVRINQDGSVDNTFNTGGGFDGTVNVVIVQSDQKILVGGDFATYDGQNVLRIARLNSDGTLDNTFLPNSTFNGFNNTVYTIELQQIDQKILVGGYFTTYSGVTQNYIVRLNTDGSIDDTFVVGDGFNFYVNTIKIQPDNKILVGGNFATYSGVTVNNIVRLNLDGSVDDTFVSGSGFNGEVNKIIIDLFSYKILVGGSFTSYDGVTSNYITRLNTDGTKDNTFIIGSGFNSYVTALDFHPYDGRIYVAGQFNLFNGNNVTYFTRLNYDGSYDTDFTGGHFNSISYAVMFNPADANVLVGGFSQYYDSIQINFLGKIKYSSQIPVIFKITENSLEYGQDYSAGYNSLSLINKGYIDALITTTGATNGLQVVGDDIEFGGVLNHDTTLVGNGHILNIVDLSGGTIQNSGVDKTLYLISTAASGHTYLASFDGKVTVQANDHLRVANYGSIGKVEIQNNGVDGLEIKNYGDGALYIQTTGSGGMNTQVSGGEYKVDVYDGGLNLTSYSASGMTLRNYGTSGITLINNGVDGIKLNSFYAISLSAKTGLDLEANNSNIKIKPENTYVFPPFGGETQFGFNGSVTQPDGKILIGGAYVTSPTGNFSGLTRINADGTPDVDFITNLGSGVYNNTNPILAFITAIELQDDGKILIGGPFEGINGISSNGIFRLNSDGTFDSGFTTNIGGGFDSVYPYNMVSGFKIQDDGKIVIGGIFNGLIGYPSQGIVRIESDGTYDPTFIVGTGFNPNVSTVDLQSDGKIVVGGSFSSYNGNLSFNTARLNTDGSYDPTFTNALGGNVQKVKVLSDDKILVGGDFTDYSGSSVNRFAKLNSDGTLDTGFTTNLGSGFNGTVSSIQLQADGKIYLGGVFNTFDGQDAIEIIRLNSDGTRDTTFTFNINEITQGYSSNLSSIEYVEEIGVLNITGLVSGVVTYFAPVNMIPRITVKNSYGMEYADDYSVNYTSRSIPDVEWVLSQVSGYVGDIVTGTSFTAVTNSSFIGVSGTSASTVYLPSSPTPFKPYIVTDIKGNATVVNINVDGNGKLIQGSSSALIDTDYGSITFVYNGFNWSITAVV
jgi:uncharacterized delta-60 repeat protein